VHGDEAQLEHKWCSESNSSYILWWNHNGHWSETVVRRRSHSPVALHIWSVGRLAADRRLPMDAQHRLQPQAFLYSRILWNIILSYQTHSIAFLFLSSYSFDIPFYTTVLYIYSIRHWGRQCYSAIVILAVRWNRSWISLRTYIRALLTNAVASFVNVNRNIATATNDLHETHKTTIICSGLGTTSAFTVVAKCVV